MEKTIYELELHESVKKQHYHVTRVPNGWIYVFRAGMSHPCAAFVPFSMEFIPVVEAPSFHSTTEPSPITHASEK